MRRYLPALWLALQSLAMVVVASAFMATPLSRGLTWFVPAFYLAASGACLWAACRHDSRAPRDVIMAWLPGLPLYIATAMLFAGPDGLDNGGILLMAAAPLLLLFVLGSTVATVVSLERARQWARTPQALAESPGLSSRVYLPAVWAALLSIGCVLVAPHVAAIALLPPCLHTAAGLLWIVASALSLDAFRRDRAFSRAAALGAAPQVPQEAA